MYTFRLFWKTRRLLEFWRGILKRWRSARSERATKGTGAYFESLESRVLLSGGVEGALADTYLLGHQDFDQAPVAGEIAFVEEAQETALLDLSGLAESDPELQPGLMNGAGMRELVFVDENVADYEQLIADLQQADDHRTIEVVVLESDRNGIEQVTQVLSERSNLSAVHFITHGADGQINLGNTWLNSTTLQENISAISAWGNALTETGDILFYGCDIAADSDGQSLLNTISDLTGADVAASDDPTGHAASGGDWELEYRVGDVETALAARGQSWEGLLANFTVNITNDTVDANPGDGNAVDSGGNTSLRAAIMESNALAGADSITLPAGNYNLTRTGTGENAATAGDLDINSEITIQGAGAQATKIDATGLNDRVFEVLSGATLNMSGVTIQGGSAQTEQGSSIRERFLWSTRQLSGTRRVQLTEADFTFETTVSSLCRAWKSAETVRIRVPGSTSIGRTSIQRSPTSRLATIPQAAAAGASIRLLIRHALRLSTAPLHSIKP